MIECGLAVARRTPKWTLWQVTMGDQVIVEAHHDPEHAACRWLRDHGFAGGVRFFHVRDNATGLIVYDLVGEAGYCISEPAAGSLSRRKWHPRIDVAGDGDE